MLLKQKLYQELSCDYSQDCPLVNWYGNSDANILAIDKVRYVGDEVAAVAADTEITEGYKVNKVEYELLPVVDDPEKAMKDDSILVHENANNIAKNITYQGNVEEDFQNVIIYLKMNSAHIGYQDAIWNHLVQWQWEKMEDLQK